MSGFDRLPPSGLAIAGLLVALSLVCWSVMAARLMMLSRSQKANAAFLRAFHHSAHPLAIFQAREHHAEAPLYHIYHAASRELAFHLVGTDEADGTFASRLHGAGRITPSQFDAVRIAMDRATAETTMRLNARMAGTSAIFRASPWLGILGAVWTAVDLLGQSSATPSGGAALTWAPFTISVLLPVLVGLLVAVPGLLGEAFVASRIRALMTRGDHFISEFSSVLQRHFVDHRAMAESLPSIGSLGTPNMAAFGTPRVMPPGAPKAAPDTAPTAA